MENSAEDSSSNDTLTCPTCGKVFTGNNVNGGLRSNYNRHLLTHTNQRPYACPKCDNTFTTSSNLKRHVQRRHPEAMVDTLATMRSSSRAPSQRRPSSPNASASAVLITPTASVVATFPSPTVPETFEGKDSNEDPDSSEPPPAKTPPTYGFLTPSPLLSAIRAAPSEVPLLPMLTFPAVAPAASSSNSVVAVQDTHRCPHCQKEFVWRNSLTQHIYLHHREVKEQFVCDACQSVLSSMTKLRRHQREHCPFRDDTVANRPVAVSFVKVSEENTSEVVGEGQAAASEEDSTTEVHSHRLRGKGKRRREVGAHTDDNDDEEQDIDDEASDLGSNDQLTSSDEEHQEYIYSSDDDLDDENKRSSTIATISKSERNRRRHLKAKEKKRRRQEGRKGGRAQAQSVPSSIASLLSAAALPLTDGDESESVDSTGTNNSISASVRLSPVTASTVGKHLLSPSNFTIRQFSNVSVAPTAKTREQSQSSALADTDNTQPDAEVTSNAESFSASESAASLAADNTSHEQFMVTSFVCPYIASGCKSKPFAHRRYLMNHIRRSHPLTVAAEGENGTSGIGEDETTVAANSAGNASDVLPEDDVATRDIYL